MGNLFAKEKLKSLSLITLPGGCDGYVWTGESLHLRESPQKKEIRLEERKTDANMYVASKEGDTVLIYGQVDMHLQPILSDFYIPMPHESLTFYKEMGERMEGSITTELAKYFNRHTSSNEVPFYPVPVTTLSGVFKYYNFKEFKNTQKRRQLVKKIRIEEEVPEADPAIEKSVKKQIGVRYGEFKEVLMLAFKKRRVWPIKGLEKYFKEHQKDFQAWKWSSVKNILACIAYTYSTGPWKKLWVQYGYNPTKDQEAYKYQVYMWKNVSKAFVIMDNPEVYEKIKETPEFTQRVFSARTGFLTDKALAYMHKKFSEMAVPEPEKPAEQPDLFHSMDFETLDN
ncbi:hypothetical protein NEAUS04_0591 [Nematocida ausubeli]|uniref:Transcription factor IIIC subunit 5 HTH domain-containing protein n=1 Tax=Nematocida ausubeli (strain ATCC PRA-371 / ERTm2) TaxID=1913371 RepID=A0A086J3D6_NEMA1|nr:uncharacterized protein NESG_00805 [Nematocida ausubeli]KAI5161532.1 hypothetical protein NEAUS04_0591 [Nematocida ausubeli]KFG26654.1 hypothetical protein NESG_00805 [Nematocida ausubeli]